MNDLFGTNEAATLTNAEINGIQRTLAHTIEKMPEKIKLVLSLYYIEELTVKEIGEVLNLSETEVLKIYFQAKILVRTLLQEEKFKITEKRSRFSLARN